MVDIDRLANNFDVQSQASASDTGIPPGSRAEPAKALMRPGLLQAYGVKSPPVRRVSKFPVGVFYVDLIPA